MVPLKAPELMNRAWIRGRNYLLEDRLFHPSLIVDTTINDNLVEVSDEVRNEAIELLKHHRKEYIETIDALCKYHNDKKETDTPEYQVLFAKAKKYQGFNPCSI